MGITVVKTGISDTVQDGGRFGYGRFGINPGGAMDLGSYRVSNLILGHETDHAAIELHFPSSEFKFESDCGFSIAGADFGAELDGTPLESGRAYNATKGATLAFRKKKSGERCYLCFKNGLEIEQWLDSWSTNVAGGVGGLSGRTLREGDTIGFVRPEAVKSAPKAAIRPYKDSSLIRFVPGPDYGELTAISHVRLRNAQFRIRSDSDRMGSRLAGEPLYLLSDHQRLSAAVTRGTIQLLPDGNLIVLMADHQTHGGYPNLGTVIGPDVDGLAQLGAGSCFGLLPVSLNEAESAYSCFLRGFDYLRAGLSIFGE